MYLTLVSITSTLDALTVKNNGGAIPGDYSHISIRHRKYADSTALPTPLLNAASGSAEWLKVFGENGVKLSVPVTDGVHLLTFLLGKGLAGKTVEADGKITGGLALEYKYVSLTTDPYTLYKVTGGYVEVLRNLSAVTLIAWKEDPNNFLSVHTAEKALAADLRAAAVGGCEKVRSLMPRFLALQSAVIKFNCKDYQGADWIIGSDSTTSNCGC